MALQIKNILTAMHSTDGFSIEQADIFIENDTIISINKVPKNFNPNRIINGNNKLVIPGLINAHTHSYMSLFRNFADDLPFNEWLFDNILPLEDNLQENDSYWGSMLGIMEMIRTGTTCFTDMYIYINETTRAVEESGIRACLTRGLVGNGNDKDGIRRINEAKSEIKDWANRGDGCISFMLGPHAPYTCDKAYLQRVIQEAKDLNIGLNIHLSESKNEVNSIKEQYNCSPVEYLYHLGFYDVKTLAAHCVHISDNDIDILSQNNVSVVTNPISNLKLANGFAPIGKLYNKNVNICMGTDGAASNNALNIFRDLSFVSLIHKGLQEDSELITASTSLEFATINGAKGLGLDSLIGTIEVGKKADLAIINLDHPQYYPRNNLISALAYSTTGMEVDTVIVNGKILMENTEYKTIDAEKVKYEVNKINERLK